MGAALPDGAKCRRLRRLDGGGRSTWHSALRHLCDELAFAWRRPIAAWGSELTSEVDLFEAGMERFIRLDKAEFIGTTASLATKQRGARIKLVYLEVDAGDIGLPGNEPIYHDGEARRDHDQRRIWPCGREIAGLRLCRSGSHAHPARRFEILMLGDRRKARDSRRAAWDP